MSTYRCRMPYCTGETWQAGGVCDDCYFARTTWLRAMPGLYLATYGHLGASLNRTAAEYIRLPSPHASLPLNMAAYDAMHRAGTVVETWAGMARTVRRSVAPKTWSGAAFVANVRVLLRDDRRITSGHAVGEYVHDLFAAYHGLAKIACGYDSKRLDRPCPLCDSVAVLARHAGLYAACLTCGAEFSHSRLTMLEETEVVA